MVEIPQQRVNELRTAGAFRAGGRKVLQQQFGYSAEEANALYDQYIRDKVYGRRSAGALNQDRQEIVTTGTIPAQQLEPVMVTDTSSGAIVRRYNPITREQTSVTVVSPVLQKQLDSQNKNVINTQADELTKTLNKINAENVNKNQIYQRSLGYTSTPLGRQQGTVTALQPSPEQRAILEEAQQRGQITSRPAGEIIRESKEFSRLLEGFDSLSYEEQQDRIKSIERLGGFVNKDTGEVTLPKVGIGFGKDKFEVPISELDTRNKLQVVKSAALRAIDESKVGKFFTIKSDVGSPVTPTQTRGTIVTDKPLSQTITPVVQIKRIETPIASTVGLTSAYVLAPQLFFAEQAYNVGESIQQSGKVIGGVGNYVKSFPLEAAALVTAGAVKGARVLTRPIETPIASRGSQLISEKGIIAPSTRGRGMTFQAEQVIRTPRTFVRQDTRLKKLGRGVLDLYFGDMSPSRRISGLQSRRIQVSPTITTKLTTEAPITSFGDILNVRGAVRRERILPSQTRFTQFRGRDTTSDLLNVRIRPSIQSKQSKTLDLGVPFSEPNVRYLSRLPSERSLGMYIPQRVSPDLRANVLVKEGLPKQLAEKVLKHERGHYFSERLKVEQSLTKEEYAILQKKAEAHLNKKYNGNIPYSKEQYVSEYLADKFTGQTPNVPIRITTPSILSDVKNIDTGIGSVTSGIVEQSLLPIKRLRRITSTPNSVTLFERQPALLGGRRVQVTGGLDGLQSAQLIRPTPTIRLVKAQRIPIINNQGIGFISAESVPINIRGRLFDIQRFRQLSQEGRFNPFSRELTISPKTRQAQLDIAFPRREQVIDFLPFDSGIQTTVSQSSSLTNLIPTTRSQGLILGQVRTVKLTTKVASKIDITPTSKVPPSGTTQIRKPSSINLGSTFTLPTASASQFYGKGTYEVTETTGFGTALPTVSKDSLVVKDIISTNIKPDIKVIETQKPSSQNRLVFSPALNEQTRSFTNIAQPQAEKTQQALKTNLTTKQAQKLSLKLLTQLKQPPYKVNVKIPIKPIPIPKIDSEAGTGKGKKELFSEELLVYTRRFGKDVLLGKAESKSEASRILSRELKGTLRASGFVTTTTGEKLKATELNLGRGFRPGKRDSFRIVQERGTRLGSFGEIREIQSSRRRTSKAFRF